MPGESPILPSSAKPEVLYQIAGEAREEFNTLTLRNRIRAGSLQPSDQLAIVGTELWKPAADYPMFARYFALVNAAAVAAKAPVGPVASMASRVLAGLAYPFTSIRSAAFIVAAFFSTLTPLISLVVTVLTSVYALGVIKKSSEGKTSPPTLAEVGTPVEWIVGLLRLIAVSLISLWPLVLLAMFPGFVPWFLGGPVALVVIMLYYPASLATVAVWKSLKIALSIQQIFRFIGILGKHYYAVVGMWLLMVGAIGLLVAGGKSVFGRSRFMIAIDVAASIWITLYASHLLGWAVHLHRDEL